MISFFFSFFFLAKIKKATQDAGATLLLSLSDPMKVPKPPIIELTWDASQKRYSGPGKYVRPADGFEYSGNFKLEKR